MHAFTYIHASIHMHVYSCIYLATYHLFIYPASHKPHAFTHHSTDPAIYPSIIFIPLLNHPSFSPPITSSPCPSTHLYIFCLPITHHPTISLFTDPSIYLPPLTSAPIPQISSSGGFIASPKWEDSDTTRRIILGRTAH